MTEDLEIRRKRLRFRCWHRGTKELDLLVGRFADAHLAALDGADLDRLEALLEVPEPLLYDWVLGRRPPDPEHDHAVMARLVAYSQAPETAPHAAHSRSETTDGNSETT